MKVGQPGINYSVDGIAVGKKSTRPALSPLNRTNTVDTSQGIARMTPPSTRNAAPVVPEACSEQA
jgi:hypothetical protein